MCPVCLAAAALIAGKAASAGGFSAIAIKRFGGKKAVEPQTTTNSSPAPSKEDRHG
jgi:hypothetical protein